MVFWITTICFFVLVMFLEFLNRWIEDRVDEEMISPSPRRIKKILKKQEKRRHFINNKRRLRLLEKEKNRKIFYEKMCDFEEKHGSKMMLKLCILKLSDIFNKNDIVEKEEIEKEEIIYYFQQLIDIFIKNLK